MRIMIRDILNRNRRQGMYIAEIGINHNGDFDMAMQMVKAAKEAGADAVKFQTFLPGSMNSLYTTALMNSGFEEFKDSSQFDFFSRFCFTENQYAELMKYSRDLGLVFFSSPFDGASVDLLEKLGVPLYKVASSEVTNHILLEKIARTGKPVLLSTGISSEYEISLAVKVLSRHGAGEVALMHCVSLYPVESQFVNLKRIISLKEKFGLDTGFSDHSRGVEAAVLAAAMGARIFEKHFVIGREYECPDRDVSLAPGEFAAMIRSLEESIRMLGDGEITYKRIESDVARSARRSLFARRFIPRGKTIEADDLVALRPGIGIPVYEMEDILGRVTRVDIDEGYMIKRIDLESTGD